MDAKNFFYDSQHAHQYLTSSVLLHKGEPIQITEVQDGKFPWVVRFQLINNTKSGKCFITDLDLKSPALGMANIEGRDSNIVFPVYYSRVPIRQWKIGLSRNNTSMKQLLKSPAVSREMQMPDFAFPGRGIFSAIRGEYPTLDQALRQFNNFSALGVAFDRHWAVDRNKKLYYKSLGRVGSIGTTSPKFNRDYTYLDKVFENCTRRR